MTNPENSEIGSTVREYKPSPITYKGAARATVDKVMLTSNENETFLIKVCEISPRNYVSHELFQGIDETS